MTSQTGSPAWPPPWGASPHPPGHEPLERSIGRLLERSETTAERVEQISTDVHDIRVRLALGDKRMTAQDRKLDCLQKAIDKRRPRRPEDRMAGWERIVKVLTPYVILPLAAWATGSWSAAVEVLRFLAGK